jgi:hypothetical protein
MIFSSLTNGREYPGLSVALIVGLFKHQDQLSLLDAEAFASTGSCQP